MTTLNQNLIQKNNKFSQTTFWCLWILYEGCVTFYGALKSSKITRTYCHCHNWSSHERNKVFLWKSWFLVIKFRSSQQRCCISIKKETVKKETLTKVFPYEFCKIFKSISFTEHLQTTTSVNWPLHCPNQPSNWKVFFFWNISLLKL